MAEDPGRIVFEEQNAFAKLCERVKELNCLYGIWALHTKGIGVKEWN